MFGFGNTYRDRLTRAYNSALQANEGPLAFDLAQEALRIVDNSKPWPFDQPERERYLGRMHGMCAAALLERVQVDPVGLAPQMIAAAELALEYLRPFGGEDYAISLFNWAQAILSHSPEHGGDAVERAIGALEEANAIDLPGDAGALRIDILVALADGYRSRSRGSRRENFERAFDYLTRAEQNPRLKSQPFMRARVVLALGVLSLHSPIGSEHLNSENAIRWLEEASALAILARSEGLWANAQANLATAYRQDLRPKHRRTRFRRALEANANSITYFEKAGAHLDLANALNQRAGLIAEQPGDDLARNLDEAIELLQRALRILSTGDFPKRTYEYQRNLEVLEARRSGGRLPSQYEKEVAKARAVVDQLDELCDGNEWAAAQSELGSCLLDLRKNQTAAAVEEAITCFENALRVYQPDSDLENWAVAKGNLANAYSARMEGGSSENVDRAIALQQEVLDRLDYASHPDRWVKAILTQAQNYLERINGFSADNVEMAIILGEEAKATITARSAPRDRAAVLMALSGAYQSRERGDELSNLKLAACQLREAIDICSVGEAGDASASLKLYNLLRRISSLEGGAHKPRSDSKSVSGKEFVDNLCELAGRIPKERDPFGWARAQISVGDALIIFPLSPNEDLTDFVNGMAEQQVEAVAAYKAALEIIDERTHPAWYASTLSRVARAHFMHFFLSETLDYGWSGLHQRTAPVAGERSERTKSALAAAIEAARKQADILDDFPSSTEKLAASCELGEYQVAARDWSGATDAFGLAARCANMLVADVEASATDLAGALKYFTKMVELAPYAAAMSGNFDEAIALAEAGRARLLAKALSIDALAISAKEREGIRLLQERVATLEAELLSPLVFDKRSRLNQIIQTRRETRIAIGEAFSIAGEASSPFGTVERLVNSTRSVVFPITSEFGGKLLVFVESDGGVQRSVVELPSNLDLERLRPRLDGVGTNTARGAAESVFAGNRSQGWVSEMFLKALDKICSDVADFVVGPLFDRLEDVAPGTQELIIVCDGVFGALPVGLARTHAFGGTFSERYQIGIIPSLKVADLLECKPRRVTGAKPWSAGVLSSRWGQTNEGELKFAEVEARVIKGVVGSEGCAASIDQSLTQEQALQLLNGHDIWHLCAHGHFNDGSPLDSGIVIGPNEQLSLRKLFERRSLSPPDLVVLSSCNVGSYATGSSRQELIGLPSALLQLGARGVIASQWIVNDAVTAVLMGRFYECLAASNNPPPVSFREAQLWVANATAGELKKKLGDWCSLGGVPETAIAELAQALGLGQCPASARPCSNPQLWAGWSYFGI